MRKDAYKVEGLNGKNDFTVWPGDKDKEVILLLHGCGGDIKHWTNPAEGTVRFGFMHLNYDKNDYKPIVIKKNIPSIALPPFLEDVVNLFDDLDPAKISDLLKFSAIGIDKLVSPLTAVNNFVEFLNDLGHTVITYSQSGKDDEIKVCYSELRDKIAPYICENILTGDFAGKRVTVIAHSRGGLLIRKYIHDPEDKNNTNWIKTVITLQSPHRGSKLAYASLVAKIAVIVDFFTTCGLIDALKLFLAFDPDGEGVFIDKGNVELRSDSKLIQDSIKWLNSPTQQIRFYSFAGSSPTLFKLYEWDYKKEYTNAGLTVTIKMVPKPLKIGGIKHSPIPDAFTNGTVDELTNGKGDILVSAASAKLGQYAINHAPLPINHVEGLWDRTLFSKISEILKTPGIPMKAEYNFRTGEKSQNEPAFFVNDKTGEGYMLWRGGGNYLNMMCMPAFRVNRPLKQNPIKYKNNVYPVIEDDNKIIPVDPDGNRNHKTLSVPAGTFFKDKLYLAFNGTDDGVIYIISSCDDGATWSGKQKIKFINNDKSGLEKSKERIGMCVLNGKIYIGYKLAAGGIWNGTLYLAEFDGDKQWIYHHVKAPHRDPDVEKGDYGVSVCNAGDKVLYAWAGEKKDGNAIYIKFFYPDADDPRANNWSETICFNNKQVNATPIVSNINGKIFLSWLDKQNKFHKTELTTDGAEISDEIINIFAVSFPAPYTSALPPVLGNIKGKDFVLWTDIEGFVSMKKINEPLLNAANPQEPKDETLEGTRYYFINKNAQKTGEREVHTQGCDRVPKEKNRRWIGYFDSPEKALEAAKKIYNNVDGCYYCCPKIHSK